MTAEVASTSDGRTRNAQAALGLRIAGASYEDVAQVLGFAGPDEARRAVERALMETAADPKERETQRALSAARIDRMLRSVFSRAVDKNDPDQLTAVRVALQLEDRRIRLYGLDAPVEHIVYNPTATEIEAWVQAMLGANEHLAIEEPDIIAIPGEVVTDDGDAA
jgi:hypothetical protein